MRLLNGQTGGEISVHQRHSNWVSFHKTARNLPHHHTIRPCDCGIPEQAAKLLSFEGIPTRTTLRCFHQTAPYLPQHLMTERWDCGKAKRAQKLLSYKGTCNLLAFSPDGTRLLSASDDKSMRLWNGWTGTEIAPLQGHSEWPNSVVFSPDGTRIASA